VSCLLDTSAGVTTVAAVVATEIADQETVIVAVL
jgi:hypothetical protein